MLEGMTHISILAETVREGDTFDYMVLFLLAGIGIALIGLAHEFPPPWARVFNIVGAALGIVVAIVALITVLD